MIKLVKKGCSIEGGKVSVNTHRKTLQAQVYKQGIKLYKYKCSINSNVEIVKELNPKKAKIKNTSNLNVGDLLEADVIEVYPEKMLRFEKKTGYTSKHSISHAKSKAYTFAEIAIPFPLFVNRVTSPVQKKRVIN